MTVKEWVDRFEKLASVQDLHNPQAQALADYLTRYARDFASVVEVRRRDEAELVVFDIRTGVPQNPAYPLRHVERVGTFFREKDGSPLINMLRDDFPDTEHQYLVPEGSPAVICVDDRPWREAFLTWTPAELIERILSWFDRAAFNKLHDVLQPLDPVLSTSGLSFIIERSTLDAEVSEYLIEEWKPNSIIPRIRPIRNDEDIRTGVSLPTCFAVYKVPPERMRRIRYAPSNLGELNEMLAARGIGLYEDLATRFGRWLSGEEAMVWRLNSLFAVVVEMPVVSPRDELQQGIDLRIFVTRKPAGDIAVALGVAFKSRSEDEASRVGYVTAIGQDEIDRQAVNSIAVLPAEIHLAFERKTATRLAGRNAPDIRKAVLVGAGAMGSHLADCLVREGRFRWTIIDHDLVLPHNLARHIAHGEQAGCYKAEFLSRHISSTLSGEDELATFIPENLFLGSEAVTRALDEAEMIIDATASVPAARFLSDHRTKARRFSTFFNPSGKSAVLLAEPQNRILTLMDLEAQYLGLVLRVDRLADHLGELPETIAYTGACGAITNRIPQSRVSILSGLAAAGMSSAADQEEAVISIWSLAPNGEVSLESSSPKPVLRYKAHDWIFTIDEGLVESVQAMRDAHLPSETGGILFGLVDIPKKSIHVVYASEAPTDSVELSCGFTRGVRGVQELIEDVEKKTAGQVRYVGEWHSHPPRTPAHPSSTDIRQVDWLASLMNIDSVPAFMLIAADEKIAIVFDRKKADLLPQEQSA